MIYLILILYKKAIVNKLSFIFKDDKDMNARCATKSPRATVDHLRAHPFTKGWQVRRMLVPLALMVPLLKKFFYL